VTSIQQIIQETLNPFDSTTFRPGNFWQEQQETDLTVDSIHQDVVHEIEELLQQVNQDRRTRTLLLAGDSGAGKSYLLGRIKESLNCQAFFAYIGPWPESDFIWRHILRNTVDSLMYVPTGEKSSQLLLWIKSLSAVHSEGFMKRFLGERQLFIHNLKGTFPSGIYNPNEFFGVLYDLHNPDLYPIACEWLKGDRLDEESLKLLRVKNAIDTETAARNILGNLGKIAAVTQPIVLCFDNLDNIDRALDGFINLQALFSVNSILHNEKLKNFFVIISVVTNTWKQHQKRVQGADLARIDREIRLQPISLDQAEALWATRLYPLHQQAEIHPRSRIYPLSRDALNFKFPGGKTKPRYVLMLGRQLFQEAKQLGLDEFHQSQQEKYQKYAVHISRPDPLAAFKLLWLKEFKKTEHKISRIRQFSAPELIKMLREALEALQVIGIEAKLLPSPKYASYSLSYHLPVQIGRIGLVWTEDPNLVGFFHMMKACEKALLINRCKTLFLIRSENLGTRKNQGNQLYSKIFTGYPHRHLLPDMISVHYLASYHNLVNAACAGELVLGDRTPNLKELQELIRESNLLQDCPLLDALGIFAGYTRIVGVTGVPQRKITSGQDLSQELQKVKDYLLALMQTQQMMGRYVLMQNTLDQFPDVDDVVVNQLITELCQEEKMIILDETAPVHSQLLCLLK